MGLTPAQVAETKAAMERHRHPDGSPNYTAMARELGIDRTSAKGRVKSIERGLYDCEPIAPSSIVQDQFSAYLDIHGRPRFRVPYRTAVASAEPDVPRSDAPVYRVVALGDHHDKPGRDKTRALWMGRFCAEHQPHAVVSIGDWASLDSLSVHEAPGSQADAERPSFPEELESLDESLSLFHKDFPVGSIPVFQVHGNHEYRAVRAANRQPKQCGDLPIRLDQVFARYRWQVRPFGQFLDLHGVDFVHVPLSIMGKEMGGENVERNVANKTTRSCVFGHTHRANFLNVSKVGQDRSIQILNLGTSLPHGTVEKYAKMSQTGWTYGVFLLRIQSGQILSAKHYDMLELEERYGD